MKYPSALFVVAASFFMFAGFAQAEDVSLTVSVQDDGSELRSFTIPTTDEAGGAELTVTDLGSDGVPEIIVSLGFGSEAIVAVYDQHGDRIMDFSAYHEGMQTGVTTTACDITGDGVKEIITGTQYGGGPHIRTFSNYGEVIDDGFFAYDESFRGGVSVSCADIDNDGSNELVTSPGPTGGPHVKIWNWNGSSWDLEQEFFAFDASETSGVIPLALGGELYLALRDSDLPVMKYQNNIMSSYLGRVGVITSLYKTDSGVTYTTDSYRASGDLDLDGNLEVLSTQTRNLFSGYTDTKRIVVDLSEQRLYAYESGILRNSFLISSGLNNATPVGEHNILAKVPYVHYAWFYGSGSSSNYDLGIVPYNLRFYPHIYIHYAYWHDNFGQPMSRGCVNVNLENMMWIYNWADEGIPVEVKT